MVKHNSAVEQAVGLHSLAARDHRERDLPGGSVPHHSPVGFHSSAVVISPPKRRCRRQGRLAGGIVEEPAKCAVAVAHFRGPAYGGITICRGHSIIHSPDLSFS